MEVELERGHDPEAAASAVGSPEEVRVLLGACGAHDAVGRDDLHRPKVVAGQAIGAVGEPEPAAEGEAGHTGPRHLPTRSRQREQLRRTVHVGPTGTRLHPGRASHGIDVDAPHRRQVDHEPVVAHRAPGHLVAATADAQGHRVFACEADRFNDIWHTGAAGR